MNKVFEFDDNSSLLFNYENDFLEIILQGRTDSGFTSANIKLTEEETKQLIEWINSLNH